MNSNTPGVKIKEIAILPSSVVQVSTAVPAILGYTHSGPKGTPVRITSMSEYVATFGGPFAYQYDIDTSGTVTVQTGAAEVGEFFLYEAMQTFFANGGGACYVIGVGNFAGASPSTSVTEADFGTKLAGPMAELYKLDEPTLILFPEAVNLGLTEYKNLVENSLSICAEMQDRFTLIDTPRTTDLTLAADLSAYRTALGSNNLKFGASYYPLLKSVYKWAIDESLSTYDGTPLATLKGLGNQTYNDAIDFLAADQGMKMTLPPSPAMAGIYARTDAAQGVWVAPANVGVQAIDGPVQAISDQIQHDLNVDSTSGKSVNAIRTFSGRGTLVWGARTLAGNDNEWRYVPVRRLFLSAEESIRKATEPYVFAPNDAKTWVKVRSMVSSYLDSLWQDGALAGAKPEDAYFVNIGLGTTMTEMDILQGNLIVEVGMAAVRPAEFIVMKFYHKVNQ